jgi:hypothetical protein
MMTLEEAGQVILEGRAFICCSACKGEGRHLIETETRLTTGQLPIEVETYQHCSLCNGKGVVCSLDYFNACTLLGKELPEPPERPTKHVRAVVAPSPRTMFPPLPQMPKMPDVLKNFDPLRMKFW